MFTLGSDDMLVPGSKYNISEATIGDFRFTTTLHINALNLQDFYEYQCVAKVRRTNLRSVGLGQCDQMIE